MRQLEAVRRERRAVRRQRQTSGSHGALLRSGPCCRYNRKEIWPLRRSPARPHRAPPRRPSVVAVSREGCLQQLQQLEAVRRQRQDVQRNAELDRHEAAGEGAGEAEADDKVDLFLETTMALAIDMVLELSSLMLVLRLLAPFCENALGLSGLAFWCGERALH